MYNHVGKIYSLGWISGSVAIFKSSNSLELEAGLSVASSSFKG